MNLRAFTFISTVAAAILLTTDGQLVAQKRQGLRVVAQKRQGLRALPEVVKDDSSMSMMEFGGDDSSMSMMEFDGDESLRSIIAVVEANGGKGRKSAKSGSKSAKSKSSKSKRTPVPSTPDTPVPTLSPVTPTLCAVMNPYPGYDGDIIASGSVKVTFPNQISTNLSYDLSGIQAGCANCGIHIHEGTTCDVADEVGGHHFSVQVDPWTTEGGATYNANDRGCGANGFFTLTTGDDTYADNVGRVVVIHAQDGSRISCGILN